MAVKIQVDPVVPGHATCDDDHAAVAGRQPASFASGGRERCVGAGNGEFGHWTHMVVYKYSPLIYNSAIYKASTAIQLSLFTVSSSQKYDGFYIVYRYSPK
jgi:hypothetical protein